jgi:hypothetical protein
LVLQIDDIGTKHVDGVVAIAEETPVVVTGDDQLVRVRQTAEPLRHGLELSEGASAAQVTRVKEDVTVRNSA